MSSSNSVRIAYIEEATYGITPGSGNFKTARFVSESLSSTPETTESQQIRTDRMSSGQVVTGLTVEGDLSFELAKETPIEDFISSAMLSSWVAGSDHTVDMDIDAGDKTITRGAGSFVSDGVVVRSFIKLSGYADEKNNTLVFITNVTATVLTYVGGNEMVDEEGSVSTAYRLADKIDIGVTKKSFSMEKAFTDLTTKALNYRGMLVSTMDLNVSYGELISGSFGFSGNDQETADSASEFMTFGRTINAPATTNTLNGSVDMPFIASSSSGTFGEDDLCIQSVSISLDNNFTALTCIGKAAPESYSAGTARIQVDLSTYLKDSAWPLLALKESQESFELAFAVQNASGGYGFYMPAVQVSFDDPASGGQDQEISLEMSGQAKVGPAGISALTIYRF